MDKTRSNALPPIKNADRKKLMMAVAELNQVETELSRLKTKERNNGMVDLVAQFQGGAYPGMEVDPSSQMWTMAGAGNAIPITLNRVLLSRAYMTEGLIQSMIQLPVIDAFKGGITIETTELDEDELDELYTDIGQSHHHARDPRLNRNFRATYLSGQTTEQTDLEAIQETRFWARLFGGAGLIVNTAQDFSQPLDLKRITKDTPMEFIPADRWELVMETTNVNDPRVPRPFNYYGCPVHRTRVLKSMGVRVPSWQRLQLQGWMASLVERSIRQINAFIKFENVIFELLDEAKLDIFKIDGFNNAMMDDEGTAMTTKRIQLANQLKNYMNSLAMDKEDGYERKQMTFAGLADLWNECRRNLASALRIPMNKLFGESSSGFGSGADSMENYNSTVAVERVAIEPLLRLVIDLRCQRRFGFVPKYKVCWPPLQTLDGEQEQMVLTAKQNRIVQLQQQGLIDGVEASLLLRRERLLSIETKVGQGKVEAIPQAAQAAMIGNEGQLTNDKRAEKREDKPRNDKQAGGKKMKDS